MAEGIFVADFAVQTVNGNTESYGMLQCYVCVVESQIYTDTYMIYENNINLEHRPGPLFIYMIIIRYSRIFFKFILSWTEVTYHTHDYFISIIMILSTIPCIIYYLLDS